ncbi:hypothetical protein ANTRET_LOCUS3218 [Anthophora retusa]
MPERVLQSRRGRRSVLFFSCVFLINASVSFPSFFRFTIGPLSCPSFPFFFLFFFYGGSIQRVHGCPGARIKKVEND